MSSCTNARDDTEVLARLINDSFAKYDQARQTTLYHALNCGQFLIGAKSRMDHGQWGDWVAQNLTFGIRQAQKLMHLASHRTKLETNANYDSGLAIDSALQLVREPKEKTSLTGLVRSPLEAMAFELKAMHKRTPADEVLRVLGELSAMERAAEEIALEITDPDMRRKCAEATAGAIAWLGEFRDALDAEQMDDAQTTAKNDRNVLQQVAK